MAEIYFATSASLPGGFTELMRTKSPSQIWASSASLLRSGFAMGACAWAPAAANTAHATVKMMRPARCNIARSSERKLSHFRINIHRTMHAEDVSPHIRPCVPLRKLDLNIPALHGSIEATGESRSSRPWDWGMGALSSGERGD